jgi:hypothetical protein
MPFSCQIKRSLLLAWQAATESYSEALNELADKAGDISVDEYEMLKRHVDRASTRSANARNTFELHVEEHGC